MFWAVAGLIVIMGAIAWAVKERTARKDAEETATFNAGLALRAADETGRAVRAIGVHRKKTRELYEVIQKLDSRHRGSVAVDGLNELLRLRPEADEADADRDELSEDPAADGA